MSANSANARPKRGRPAGRNRVPLTAEQRRERNAQYERERRQGLGAASSDLAEAVGCSKDTPTYELIKMVQSIIKQPRHSETVHELTQQNRGLEEEIAKLEEQIEIHEITEMLLDVESESQAKEESKENETQINDDNAKKMEEIERWLLEPF